ncbi:hypothetical protein F1D05_09695 [Kribbella qitaiheensis]|uniref:DUF7694 domain-containing protein n=1 Tax=Kribbella qitaiheensis TaxID=1544730 RepID=A0A7G6WVU5_9ACTN|nr:hypothetical protein [Kribbella qitaiheensis]QNE18110.1 hypothetical protein F1D05_09695 [Kribbella qitaiheensis]
MPKASRSGNPAKAAGRQERWTSFVRHQNIPTGEQVWQNSRYTVLVAVRNDHAVRWAGLEGAHDAHLSFRRRDRQPEPISWRDIQRIKSELCGSEAEALECFPAESRLIDGSNQRHLWVWRQGKPNAPRLGWYGGRAVLGAVLADADAATVAPLVTVHTGNLSNARQNPFEDGANANLNLQGVIWS